MGFVRLVVVPLMILALMVVATPLIAAESSITCNEVYADLIPCASYLTIGSSLERSDVCCSRVRSLEQLAQTTSDRQTVCRCLKTAFVTFGVNPVSAATLPAKCNIQTPYEISPSIDCNSVI